MPPDRARVVAVIALVVLIALAGCVGGLSDDAQDADQTYAADDAAVDDADADADADTRHVIRTGHAVVVVDDFEEARANVRSLAEDRGGYVEASERDVHREDNQTWTSGTLVIRVPSDEFDDVHEEIGEEGLLLESATETEDVTDQIVDLEARLENLEAQRDRLRDLYEDADRTDDVLRIESELSAVQEDIERTETTLTTLEEQVQYATITVHLEEPTPDEEHAEMQDADAWYEVGLIEAVTTSFSAMATAARMGVVVIAYLTPVALVFSAPFVVGYVVFSRLRT